MVASQNAGLNEIPAVVIEADDIKALEFAIVENVQNDLGLRRSGWIQKTDGRFGYDQGKVENLLEE